MSDHVINVTDGDFESEVLNSATPVLVDFWAEWCGPCKMMAPTLDQVAEATADKIKVAKLDISENNQTPMQYGVRSIPALLIFKEGKVVAQTAGAMSANELTTFIESNI